jgi:hypothetical protein
VHYISSEEEGEEDDLPLGKLRDSAKKAAASTEPAIKPATKPTASTPEHRKQASSTEQLANAAAAKPAEPAHAASELTKKAAAMHNGHVSPEPATEHVLLPADQAATVTKVADAAKSALPADQATAHSTEPATEKTTEPAAADAAMDDPDLDALLAEAAKQYSAAADALLTMQDVATKRTQTAKAKELEMKHAAVLAGLKDEIAELEHTVDELTVRDATAAGSVTVSDLDFRARTKASDTQAVELNLAKRKHEKCTALIGESRAETTKHEATCAALNRKITPIASMIATFDANKAKLDIETARSLAADVVDDAESENLQHTIDTLEAGLRSNENLCSILAKSKAELATASKLAADASARALEAEQQATAALALCTSLETALRTLEDEQRLAELNLKAAEVAHGNVATELREASAALKAKRDELELALKLAPPAPAPQSLLSAVTPVSGAADVRPDIDPPLYTHATHVPLTLADLDVWVPHVRLPDLPHVGAFQRVGGVYDDKGDGIHSHHSPQVPATSRRDPRAGLFRHAFSSEPCVCAGR